MTGVEVGGQPEHEHVEGEADDELVGGEAVAEVGLDERHDEPGGAADEDAEHAAPRRPVHPEGGAEGAGEEHPLDRDVQRAGPLGHPLAGGGEEEHDRELEGADVQRVRAEKTRRGRRATQRLTVGRASPASCRPRAGERKCGRRATACRRPRGTCRRARSPAGEQRQHEQRLHDVGHLAVDAGGGEEARPGAQGGEHERHRDRHEDAVAGEQGDEQAVPAEVAGVPDATGGRRTRRR